VKLRILEENADFLLVEVIGEDISLVHLLTETINQLPGVQYAGCRLEHPLTGVITMSVKVDPTKTSPRNAVLKAFEALKGQLQDLQSNAEALR